MKWLPGRENSGGSVAHFKDFDVVIFGSGDDEFHAAGWCQARCRRRRRSHGQTHDGGLVSTAEFARAAELAHVPDAHLVAGGRVQHRTALTAQCDVVDQRFTCTMSV